MMRPASAGLLMRRGWLLERVPLHGVWLLESEDSAFPIPVPFYHDFPCIAPVSSADCFGRARLSRHDFGALYACGVHRPPFRSHGAVDSLGHSATRDLQKEGETTERISCGQSLAAEAGAFVVSDRRTRKGTCPTPSSSLRVVRLEVESRMALAAVISP